MRATQCHPFFYVGRTLDFSVIRLKSVFGLQLAALYPSLLRPPPQPFLRLASTMFSPPTFVSNVNTASTSLVYSSSLCLEERSGLSVGQ